MLYFFQNHKNSFLHSNEENIVKKFVKKEELNNV